MRRAVGYCNNLECEDFLKGCFLLNHGEVYNCIRCRQLGWIEGETVIDENIYNGVYKSVRIEFDYRPLEKKYHQTAIVGIPFLSAGGCYTLRTPLVKTETRALKIAENIIIHLNSGIKDREQMTQPTLINMDLPWPQYQKALEAMAKALDLREKILIRIGEQHESD